MALDALRISFKKTACAPPNKIGPTWPSAGRLWRVTSGGA